MSNQLHHQIKNQPQVKVVQLVHDTTMDNVLFVTFAAVFAGVFYFWGVYFWSTGGAF